MRFKFTFIAVILLFSVFANAQQIDRDKIIEEIEKNGCVVTEEGKVKNLQV